MESATSSALSITTSDRTSVVCSRHGVRSCGHLETRPAAAMVIEQVSALHEALLARPHLAPEPTTDELFGRRGSTDRQPAARAAGAVLGDPAVARLLPSLRRLCADGEFELERSWARRIADHPDPGGELARFPYHRNYGELTRLEHHTVAGLRRDPVRPVLFIGSGPRPLTSLLLAERHGWEVDNLDRGPTPCVWAPRSPLGLGRPGLRFRVGDLLGADDGYHWERYDLVYLAALADIDPEAKHRLLGRLGRGSVRGVGPRPQRPLPARPALPRPGPRRPARPANPHRRDPYTKVVNSVVVAQVP